MFPRESSNNTYRYKHNLPPRTKLQVITDIMPLQPPRPFWPRGSPSSSAGAWAHWGETFIGYANLLHIVNNSTLTEVLKLKLLRLLPGVNGQTPFDARRLNEASSVGDALYSIRVANDNIFAAHINIVNLQLAWLSVKIKCGHMKRIVVIQLAKVCGIHLRRVSKAETRVCKRIDDLSTYDVGR